MYGHYYNEFLSFRIIEAAFVCLEQFVASEPSCGFARRYCMIFFCVRGLKPQPTDHAKSAIFKMVALKKVRDKYICRGHETTNNITSHYLQYHLSTSVHSVSPSYTFPKLNLIEVDF